MFTLLILLSVTAFINGFGITPCPCEFPQQVALVEGSNHICSGAVISNDWVLTTARCVEDRLLIKLTVVLDVNHHANTDGYNMIQIEQKIIHENYTNEGGKIQNDVALLRIKPNGFNISEKIIKIASHNYKTYAGQICATSGWAMNVTGNIIQETCVSVLSHKKCIEYWSTETVFDETVCAKPYSATGGSIPCITDRGAPLVCGDELVGVNSWGIDECQNTYFLTSPRVYTRVTSYNDWINTNCHNCSV